MGELRFVSHWGMAAKVRDLDADATVRLNIVAAAFPGNPDKWEAQRELIRGSGAGFDGDNRSWFLLVQGPLSNDRLHPLWKAVLAYGTHVTVDGVIDKHETA